MAIALRRRSTTEEAAVTFTNESTWDRVIRILAAFALGYAAWMTWPAGDPIVAEEDASALRAGSASHVREQVVRLVGQVLPGSEVDAEQVLAWIDQGGAHVAAVSGRWIL